MNIGFDLDKVFINHPPFMPDSLISFLYKEKDNGVLSYRIPSKPEQLIRYLSHYSLFRPPIRENLDFLYELPRNKNHTYYLISSRFGFLKKRTEELVKKYQLTKYFKELAFNYKNEQPHIFKDTIIKKYKIHKYVDDDFSLLRYISSRNSKTTFYWLNPQKEGIIWENIVGITKLSQIIK